MNKLVLITGAAKGIGAAICEEITRADCVGSYFLIFDKLNSKLNETKDTILKMTENKGVVKCITVDFAQDLKIEDYIELLKINLPEEKTLKQFNKLVCVYNHGTLLHGSIIDVASNNLRSNFEINLFSIWTLLASINVVLPSSLLPKQFHINISSDFALDAQKNWSGMCCARASRDMLFKCFALENQSHRVLNYCPGIVKTDMLKEAIKYSLQYKDYSENTNPNETAKYLVNIINEDNFISGTRLVFKK